MRFSEAVSFVEGREVLPRLPPLEQKKVLEIAPRQTPFAKALGERGVKTVAVLGGTKEKELFGPTGGGAFILSHWESLPFVASSWDFVLVRAPFLKGSLGRLLHEVSRVLTSGGGLLLTDLHPFSLMVQQQHLKNPASEEGPGPGFERYHKIFRESGLVLEGVKEIFFDGSLKKFFASSNEEKLFATLRKTPLLILFQLKKGGQ